MIMLIDGGIRIPSVPPAASVPRKRRSLYLCLSISAIATTPIVAAVATLDPDTEPNSAHEPTFECISPPGSHDSHWVIALYMRSAIPLRSRISPNMM
jgi:hypothetical protein